MLKRQTFTISEENFEKLKLLAQYLNSNASATLNGILANLFDEKEMKAILHEQKKFNEKKVVTK